MISSITWYLGWNPGFDYNGMKEHFKNLELISGSLPGIQWMCHIDLRGYNSRIVGAREAVILQLSYKLKFF